MEHAPESEAHDGGRGRSARHGPGAGDDRGRSADHPAEIPPRGWLDIAWRTLKDVGNDNVTLVAGGLAMSALLSVFPGLAAAVAVYGIFASPADVVHQLEPFARVLPGDVWNIFRTQLQSVASHETSTLTVTAGVGLLLALWSARSAMAALMTATNIAYKEHEKRNFFVQVLISLGFTVGAVLAFLLMLLVGLGIPAVLKVLGTSDWLQWLIALGRWTVLWLFAVFGLALVYRYAPARRPPRWRWVTWGSAIAAALWLIASILFAFYVRAFGSYGRTYGALGGFIVLLMWFYISGLIVILGAEINAEMERQTTRDTTTGPGAPMGERGAFAADTIGPEAGSKDPATPRTQPIQGR